MLQAGGPQGCCRAGSDQVAKSPSAPPSIAWSSSSVLEASGLGPEAPQLASRGAGLSPVGSGVSAAPPLEAPQVGSMGSQVGTPTGKLSSSCGALPGCWAARWCCREPPAAQLRRAALRAGWPASAAAAAAARAALRCCLAFLIPQALQSSSLSKRLHWGVSVAWQQVQQACDRGSGGRVLGTPHHWAQWPA